MVVAPAPSRTVISADVAPRVTVESVSRMLAAARVKAAEWVKPEAGIITLPEPVVARVKAPPMIGVVSAKVKFALVAVKLAAPPLAILFKINPSASTTVNNPVPAWATDKSLNEELIVMAAAPSRKVISAEVAPKVIVESVSRILDAARVNAAEWIKPVAGIIKLPVPVVARVRAPPMVGVVSPKVKFALVAVKLAAPPLAILLRINASASTTVNNPVPV